MTNTELVPVEVGDGLTVHFYKRLSWPLLKAIKFDVEMARIAKGEERAGGAKAFGKLSDDEQSRLKMLSAGEVLGLLQEGYLIYGIAKWSLPIPVMPDAIKTEIIDKDDRVEFLAEKADELYSEQVLLPLVKMGARSSQLTSSNGSTLVTTGSSAEPQKRSTRSSTSITPTDAIERTPSSPDGDSSS